MRFFVGMHHPHRVGDVWDAGVPACVSVNSLRRRRSDFRAGDWIMDSGSFTELLIHGRYRYSVADYAAQIRRWARCGTLLSAVAQDYMCEPQILARTGGTIDVHQHHTIERYDLLLAERPGVYIMPVLQGFQPEDYVRHIHLYGDRLKPGQLVGVGSICKRNTHPGTIAAVLRSIKQARQDLALHGFGVKISSLADARVRDLLHSADSLAWSLAERYEGRSANNWRAAVRFANRIKRQAVQLHLLERAA